MLGIDVNGSFERVLQQKSGTTNMCQCVKSYGIFLESNFPAFWKLAAISKIKHNYSACKRAVCN